MTDQEMRIAIAEACGIDPDMNDLNAMHEAETTLTHAQRIEYATRVIKMVHGPTWAFDAITLSARQRAEAFVRTLGKWKD